VSSSLRLRGPIVGDVASLDLFERLVDALHVGVLLEGAAGETLVCNDAALELLGMTREQLDGSMGLEMIRPDGSEFPASEYPALVARRTGSSVRDVILGIVRPKCNDRVWLLVHAEPDFDDVGQVRQVLCTFTDISERINHEDRQRFLAKMEVIGRMASGVSHDFNNLLATIRAHSDLAKLHAEDRDMVDENLRGIDDVVEQAKRLNERLLGFAKRGERGPSIAFRLNEVVRTMTGLLRALLGDPIFVSISLCDEDTVLFGDLAEIEQVILNLAVNARDALARGGLFQLRTERVVRGNRELVRLTASDDGPGIASGQELRIFEPFFTTKSAEHGTGLGLATCKEIVERWGGTILARRSELGGAAFEVELPAGAVGATPTLRAIHSLQLPHGCERILVAEDDRLLGELTVGLLKSLGYDVAHCRDGLSALELCTKEPFDGIVTDVLMPKMGGIELVSKLRELDVAVPVLAVSAQARLDDSHHGWPEGVPHLRKPFGLAELARAVRSLLDSQRGSGDSARRG